MKYNQKTKGLGQRISCRISTLTLLRMIEILPRLENTLAIAIDIEIDGR